jgi:uncharacterized protein YcbX
VLSALRLYPVKSCRGLSLRAWDVDHLGLRLDRAFMIVDAASGTFLTQRDEPRLARIAPALEGAELALAAGGAGEVRVPLDRPDGPRRRIRVWGHQGDGVDQGDEAAAWLSRFLGRGVRLVRTPPDHARRVNPEWSPVEAHTAFSDGYPLLLVSEGALEALNARLAAPIPIERFRPNLVVAGCEPHAEDGWRRLRVGALEILLVKPCDRCAVTTVDQRTGERTGAEPLRTLASYRRRDGAVWFGHNAVALATGRLEVGAAVEVLETQRALPFDAA